MIVASIDTKTGRTVLVSVPRNFEWPRSRWTARPGAVAGGHLRRKPRRAQLPAQGERPGRPLRHQCHLDRGGPVPGGASGGVRRGRRARAHETRDVVGEVLGLKIDHLVVIDLKGFTELVNAMGGVEVNVKLGGFDGKTPALRAEAPRRQLRPLLRPARAPVAQRLRGALARAPARRTATTTVSNGSVCRRPS